MSTLASINVRPRRTLVLVDIENLVGSANPTPQDVQHACDALDAVTGPDRRKIHVHVACSHFAAHVVAFAWQGSARHHWKSGADGADLALLEVIDNPAWVADRYDAVVIGSADGIFEEAAARLIAHGVEVTVVYGDGSLSNRLRRTVRRSIRIRSCPHVDDSIDLTTRTPETQEVP